MVKRCSEWNRRLHALAIESHEVIQNYLAGQELYLHEL
jgi:hypothetical protein